MRRANFTIESEPASASGSPAARTCIAPSPRSGTYTVGGGTVRRLLSRTSLHDAHNLLSNRRRLASAIVDAANWRGRPEIAPRKGFVDDDGGGLDRMRASLGRKSRPSTRRMRIVSKKTGRDWQVRRRECVGLVSGDADAGD